MKDHTMEGGGQTDWNSPKSSPKYLIVFEEGGGLEMLK